MKDAARLGGVHGGIFIAILVSTAALFPVLGWPWYLLAPLAAYAVVAALAPLRRTAPQLRIGRMSGLPLAGAIFLSAATAAVLVAFDAFLQPDTSELAAKIPVADFGSLAVAGVCFSILNAIMEELVFRGVLYEALAAEWGDATAIIVGAAIFGLAHIHGYPPGPLGGFLAGGFGVALGMLRWWTGGLGLPVACHIAADATIFTLLASSGAWAAQTPPV